MHGGNYVLAPLDDYMGRAIYYSGDLDRKITWVCSRLVRPGDTVLDIGANLGLVTLILSSLVGETGQVHAFEPIPALQENIVRSAEKNGVSNITVHRMALGNETRMQELSVPPGHAGRASFVSERQNAQDTKIAVPVERLSTVLARESIGAIRLIKIDVEGFEAEVLRGAIECFSKTPPDAIVFELKS